MNCSDFKSIIEKIRVHLEEKNSCKILDIDIAKELNISKEHLCRIKKENKIPLESIINFCAKENLVINYILFDQALDSLHKNTDNIIKIKYFKNINCSAGGGAFNYDDNFEYISIDKALIDSLYKSNLAKEDSLFAIKIIGDSMEDKLFNEDIVLVDKENTDITKDGIFVISTNIGLFVKRVNVVSENCVELISNNKNYKKEVIHIDELENFRILGKVLGRIEFMEN